MTARRSLPLRLAVLLLAAPTVVALGAAPASAADECGSGWHKQSDGLLSGSQTYDNYGRTMKASVSGYVRYCTRERSNRPDQYNQSIHIGLPSTVVSTGTWSGSFKADSQCLKQVVQVVFAHQDKTTDVGISGKSPGFIVSHKDSSVEFTRSKCTNASKATFESVGMILTASDQGGCPPFPGAGTYIYCTEMHPHVKSITVHTTVEGRFVHNGVDRSPAVTQSELDTSANT